MRRSCTTHHASKPRIIVPKYPSRRLVEISFVPIKGNRILLFAKYLGNESYLHLSIHGIRSDNRVGPILWSFNGSVDSHFDIHDLVPIKATDNALGVAFGVQFDDHWKLFDISTIDTNTVDNFPLIEFGRIDFGLKLVSKWDPKISLGLFELSCSH